MQIEVANKWSRRAYDYINLWAMWEATVALKEVRDEVKWMESGKELKYCTVNRKRSFEILMCDDTERQIETENEYVDETELEVSVKMKQVAKLWWSVESNNIADDTEMKYMKHWWILSHSKPWVTWSNFLIL